MKRPIITLTTDFGTHDSYVGVMKGVILGICPDAQIVDITHELPPQDIISAATTLQTFDPYFPPGTTHIIIVDPGVGSERRALAIETPTARYIGPDNGVLGLIWKAAQARWSPAEVHAVALSEPRFWRPTVSATFHGRDIFAPVAAHLTRGVPLDQLGPFVDQIVMLPLADPIWAGPATLIGHVSHIDHFGNCISNITAAYLEQLGPLHELRVRIGTRHVDSIKRTYADVDPGATLALLDSSGRLEWAVRNGNASRSYGIGIGEMLYVDRLIHTEAPGPGLTQASEPHDEQLAPPPIRSRILITDDDESICRTLKSVLEMEGYSAEVVYGGIAAVERLAAQRFDMLITDLAMPDMDGLTLIKYCQEHGIDVTVIIMTGYASLQSAIQALQLGAYDYVLKPFDPPVLLAAVARAAERQQLRRELEQRKNMELISRLAFTVRHEINNPLAAIMGLAQLHLEEPLNDDLRADLETITRSAQRISESLQRLTHLRKMLFTDTGVGDGSTMLTLEEGQHQSQDTPTPPDAP